MTTMVENPKSATVPVLVPEADRETLAALLASARPENTRKTYATQWSAFTAYCRTNGLQPLPAEADAVGGFLAYLLRTGASKSRISVARSAILAVHKDSGCVDHAMSLADHHGLFMVSRGIAQHFKQQRVTTTKARAFTQAQVVAASQACPQTPRGVQDRAVLLIGVNVGLRASELVGLRLKDISEAEQGLNIFVAHSKTDQDGEGAVLALASLPPRLSDVDGVRAVQAWLDVLEDLREADPDAPLIRRIHRGGMRVYSTGVSEQAISDLVRRVCARADIDPDGYSGHSLRATMATLAYQNGVSEERIQATTRHGSVSVLRGYNRSGHWVQPSSRSMWGVQ
ncbi:tyrosine-type recombinase/integrase [Cellulomonas sp. APG4]|uniref:tyrosine-type recombinase/integrase n=1 Tax=Cellulomonas sp. APG4 TaxID=1538656 RepID=UPI0013797EF7|nr:tyrosine-type recombinase/integrase [Cellulomonas sp. APG4]NCT90376.1 tyrosine-type recombinase/integrase [Cellulomonas sp. APG4]